MYERFRKYSNKWLKEQTFNPEAVEEWFLGENMAPNIKTVCTKESCVKKPPYHFYYKYRVQVTSANTKENSNKTTKTAGNESSSSTSSSISSSKKNNKTVSNNNNNETTENKPAKSPEQNIETQTETPKSENTSTSDSSKTAEAKVTDNGGDSEKARTDSKPETPTNTENKPSEKN